MRLFFHKQQETGQMIDKKELFSTAKKQEKAVLVSLISKNQSYEKAQEYLEELEFLATTLGVKTVNTFTQKMEKPDSATFIGSGKLEEIKSYIEIEPVDMVIFDDDLSPSQVRNLEREMKVPIYDRSLLILDIFLLRAKTNRARTQVELARYQYILPRLRGMWTHLERQRGGTGTRGGAGEKEIETDRRIVKDQISLLKEKLKKIDKQAFTQRKSRGDSVRVALVGYTNVGKSTLMKLLSKEDVFAENKLFATIDSTVRKVVFENIPFLLTDTVGFIRKLPHDLIECFKSTLDEIREADILLHVVDVSHPSFEEQISVVESTLSEIGCGNKKTILVFNKIDQYQNPEEDDLIDQKPTLDRLRGSYMNDSSKTCVFISAFKKTNMEELRKILVDTVKKRYYEIYPNYVVNVNESE